MLEMKNKMILDFFIGLISKLQKSVSELEKLCNDKNGANLVFPSRHDREKVLIRAKHQIFYLKPVECFGNILCFVFTGFEGQALCRSIYRKGAIQFP